MTARKGYGAAVAALLWLLGFDVAPMAHMVLHEALGEHEHGHRHHHDQDHGHEHRIENANENEIANEIGNGNEIANENENENENGHENHGEGSVAHRDLAAQVPVPSVPVVLEALLTADVSPLPSHDERPADRRPRTSRARAPPSLAA